MCRHYEKGLQAYLRAVDLSGASSVMLSKGWVALWPTF